MFRRLLITLLSLCACQRLFAQAAAEGVVKLPKPLATAVMNQRYQQNLDTTVIEPDPPTAVVYLEGNFPAIAPAKARMGQKNLEFETSLLPIQLGTTVEFPNEDSVYHNIFSFSKPKRFDLGRYRKNETPVPSVVFDKPGPVVLHCDIHEHMQSIVLVLASPYFVKTDLAGKYRLGGLPAGHYTLKAWVNSKTVYERAVDLKAGGVVHADFP